MARYDHDIIVLGAGAGGLVVAGAAASLGLKVALIEKGKMGGDCLNYGCVPSKAIIHAASIAKKLKEAKKIGINVDLTGIEFKKVMDYVHNVQLTIGVNDSKASMEKQGVKVFLDSAKFINKHALELSRGQQISAKKICIATGAHAGNLIHELILAATARLPLLKISAAIHIYPTLAQITQRTVGKYLSQKYSGPFSKKLARFLFNLR